MAKITKPYTFVDNQVAEAPQVNSNFDVVYNVVNGGLDTNNLATNAGIVNGQLAQLTTGGLVAGSSLTTLTTIPSAAGVIPAANLPTGLRIPIANSSLAQITTASKVSGTSLTGLASIPSGAGVIPTVNLGSGTANSTTILYGDQTYKTAPISFVPSYTEDSSSVIASALTERSTVSASYTKLKEITLFGSGDLYFTFNMKDDTATGYVTIYRNGSAVGTEKNTSSSTYVAKTDTITGWSNGDKIQVYAKSNGASSVYVNNFIVYGTLCTINTN